tara:strand:+ start:1270 stop:1473 length:204 start_codon:yes stop_codon:yes gene_type:complete
MKWVLAKNITSKEHGMEQLVAMGDPFGRMVVFNSKAEAEEFVNQAIVEGALEHDEEPTLIIPETEML